jgi:pSer/pThr/pTyr-binding forkhead associated (FHA) protein
MEAVLQGPFGRTVLGPNVINIGRASDNQLVVKDQTTSSHHAEIRTGAYGYSLSDLSSTNGTFVNERKLEQHRPYLLQGGDSIRIGGVKFMYEEGSPSLQSQLMQEDSFDDEPTVQLKSSAYRANGRGEQWGYQPPATLSINTTQQQPAPQFFTPALQEPDSPHWETGEITSYGMHVQQQPYTHFTHAAVLHAVTCTAILQTIACAAVLHAVTCTVILCTVLSTPALYSVTHAATLHTVPSAAEAEQSSQSAANNCVTHPSAGCSRGWHRRLLPHEAAASDERHQRVQCCIDTN